MMNTNPSKAGGVLLLVSLGAACGSSGASGSGGGGHSTDGGNKGDAGATLDGAGSGDDGSSGGSEASDDAEGLQEAGNPASTLAVNLASAINYVILAKSGISTVPTSAVTGSIAVSPQAATYITGFSLTADPTNVFSTSTQVSGRVYASDYAVPTPSDLTAAVDDMMTAFTDAAGRAPNVTELGAGNIGGMTLSPGVYKWSSGVTIPTDLTLTGTATSVWIFQIAQDLTMSGAKNIVLEGGAVAKNVFWEVAGAVDLGTTSHFEGVILCQTAIVLETGASIEGRLLAQKNVNIAGSAVTEPAP
jgi:hypothetical protein